MVDHQVRYFEDYAEGVAVDCGEVMFDEASMIAFAKEYDPQPFHTDPVTAAEGPYGGLIASGWHTAASLMRLLVENYLSAESSLGSPGIENLHWYAPVRPGDTLSVRVTVLSARSSRSKPDRGIVTSLIEAVNQNDTKVLDLTATNFVLTRPS
ncbi:MAG TPA: MaoC family dehydratase [Streptosporangiaceae bacterium]|nr:MaoC family dehydratase [Streptosporangiaceae bacterium]